jgi:hypothetical protein
VAEVVYLTKGEVMPDEGDNMRWLLIHHSGDGRFFGSGFSWKESGERVGYRSLSEDDVSLEAALSAAQSWATQYKVPKIWVEAPEQG